MSTICKDCGIDAWHQWDTEQGCMAHEDFYVHNELWDAACPDDLVEECREPDGTVVFRNGKYVLCIGCFEERLGRHLLPADFKPGSDPDNWYWRDLVGRPHSTRYRTRLTAS